MIVRSASFFKWTPLFLLLTLPASQAIAGATETLDWMQKVSDIRMEFRHRIKYSRRPNRDAIDAAPMENQWKQIEALPTAGVDPAVTEHFKLVKKYEFELKEKMKEAENAQLWFTIRIGAEALGGDSVKDIYDSLPDGTPAKQDLGSVVQSMGEAYAKWIEANHQKNASERQLVSTLKSNYGADGQKMVETITVLDDIVAVAKSEQTWLKDNWPAELTRDRIEGVRRTRAAKDKLEQIHASTFVSDLQQFGGPIALEVAQHFRFAEAYEGLGLQHLAAPHYEKVASRFLAAVREAMFNKARTLDSDKEMMAKLHALQQATLTTWAPRRGFGDPPPPRLVVQPHEKSILTRMAKVAGDQLGYVGMFEYAENVMDLAVAGDKLIVLGTTTIGIYDLKTGQEAGIVIPERAERLRSMAVPQTGDYAYVKLFTGEIIRFDLKRKAKDESFKIPSRSNDFFDVSPDGKYVANTWVHRCDIHSTATGKKVKEVKLAGNIVNKFVSFGADSKTVILGGNDRKVTVFNIQSEQLLNEQPVKEYTRRGELTSDGTLIAGCVNNLYVFRGKKEVMHAMTNDGEGYSTGGMEFLCLTLSADNKHIVTEHGIWRIADGKEVVGYSVGVLAEHHVITPDAQRMAFASGKFVYVVPVIIGPDAPSAVVAGANDNPPVDPKVDPNDPAGDPNDIPKDPAVDPQVEKDAAGELRLAKLTAMANAEKGRIAYQKVIMKYPGTKAAEEAMKLLGE